jgi:MerR family Zn(II)-responsive transcriptional regulator of zntA
MFNIGELAKRHQIKADTLRFYEKHGLLIPSSRSESGYRKYTVEDERKLGFILRAKRIGFTLQDIAELLSIRIEREQHSCEEAKQIVDTKLLDVQQRIHELEIFKESLSKLSQSCCGGPEPATHCSIMEALEDSLPNFQAQAIKEKNHDC